MSDQSGDEIVVGERLRVSRDGICFEIRPRRAVTRIADATQAELSDILSAIAAIEREEAPHGARVEFVTGAEEQLVIRVTVLPRPGGLSALPGFTPGQDQPFLSVVRRGLEHAQHADLLVSFLMASGVRAIADDLKAALADNKQVRVLTGDYMGTTEPEGLAALLGLMAGSDRLQVHLYCCPPGQTFHAKAYLFIGDGSAAYVGSSNLSRTALNEGIEWNLRAVETQREFAAIRKRFDQLWNHPNAKPLTPQLLDEYRRRRPARRPVFEPDDRVDVPVPHAIQEKALLALARTRAESKARGLVVLATGLGKTLLSAFDFAATGFRRALFVAHREEILAQARAAWGRVLPDRSIGRWSAGRREKGAELVFASIQSITHPSAIVDIDPEAFDYVVIDEFHHAAADTYKRLLELLRPRFLLGLTATPERADGDDLLRLCCGNLVYRAGLKDGLAERLLVPFRYFGLVDRVDYNHIDYSAGRFDEAELTRAVTSLEYADRALAALDERTSRERRRVIVFCCNVDHADFMADFMRRRGIAAAAVHSKSTSAPRAESLRKFKAGELTALTAVDLFNEGLDVPDIDAVLMLRPTESPVVFLQQIGRGLRVNHEREKPYLTIVDLVGNHRAFLNRLDVLRMLLEDSRERVEFVRALRRGLADMPEGASIELTTEAIDMLEELCAPELEKASRAEISAKRLPTAIRLNQTGGKPILLPIDHAVHPHIPAEDTDVDVGGETLVLCFRSVAVNVAHRKGAGEDENVLPELLRGWFGADAGKEKDYVELSWRDGRWHLRPSVQGRAPIRGRLPLYRDLEVACGIGSLSHGEPESYRIKVLSRLAVDPSRHFVVRASGDSMDGGTTPIRDGDLVLCEWAKDASLADVAGVAALLVLDDGPESNQAVLKVPIPTGDALILRSWSPDVKDRKIEPGTSVRVIARVRGTVILAPGSGRRKERRRRQ